MKKKVSILGSTGSIGVQCLNIIQNFDEYFEIVSLSAGSNEKLFEEQGNRFKPSYYLSHGDKQYGQGVRLDDFESVLKHDDSDLIFIAISGIAGLVPTLLAVNQGRKIALANKESIVAVGKFIMESAQKTGAQIIPLDSEHSAIWQCITGEDLENSINSIVITASGGSLRDRSYSDLERITIEQVLDHPTWTMGKKITVDSATLINKVFEVQEAINLFSIPFEKIEVLLHRESIVHGMIRFLDGNVKAMLAPPDMRFPISYALFHPDRRFIPGMPELDFNSINKLSFEKISIGKLPWFKFGMDIISEGGLEPAFLVGADQAAVEMFLLGKIKYTDMLTVMKSAYERKKVETGYDLESAKEMINWAYKTTLSLV